MLGLQQFIVICLISLGAGFAGSYLARASGYSLFRKRLREVETEVASLVSEHAKVLDLVKKISQRQALSDHRQALSDHRHKAARGSRSDTGDPPPAGDKAAARMFYLRGKSHQEIARMATGVSE